MPKKIGRMPNKVTREVAAKTRFESASAIENSYSRKLTDGRQNSADVALHDLIMGETFDAMKHFKRVRKKK